MSTIREMMVLGKTSLQKTSHSPFLDAEVLLAFVLKRLREYLYSHPKTKLTPNQLQRYKKLVKKRAKGEPVAYLTKQKEFFGLPFYVDQQVLIPRPETELMVEKALEILKHQMVSKVIDLGTGSGCIIISIVKTLSAKKHGSLPRFYASDISKAALTVAKKNAKKHGVLSKIKFLHGNLLAPFLRDSSFLIPDSLIVANLPYLTPHQLKSKELSFEPRNALAGGRTGTAIFIRLFKQLRSLRKQIKNLTVLLEIDPGQTVKIKKQARNYLSRSNLKAGKDFSGRNRMMEIFLP